MSLSFFFTAISVPMSAVKEKVKTEKEMKSQLIAGLVVEFSEKQKEKKRMVAHHHHYK